MIFKRLLYGLTFLFIPVLIACGGDPSEIASSSTSTSTALIPLSEVEVDSITFDGETIEWSNVISALTYDIQINQNSFISTGSSTRYDFTSSATFTVKIQANGNPSTHLSSRSATKTFEKLLDINPDHIQYAFPNISWTHETALDGFDYELKVGENLQSSQFTSQARIINLLAGTSYQVRIRPVKNSTLENKEYFSLFSPWVDFEFLNQPVATFNTNANRVEWNRVTNATNYELVLLKAGNVVETVTIPQGSNPSYNLTTNDSGTFSVRIRALGLSSSKYKNSSIANHQLTKLATPSINRIEDLASLGASRIYFNEVEGSETIEVNVDGNSLVASFDGTTSQHYVDYGFGINQVNASTFTLTAKHESSLAWHANSNVLTQSLAQVARPQAVISNNLLVWQSVPNSLGYIITIGSRVPVILTDTTILEFDFLNHYELPAGLHSVRMQSKGNGITTLSSFFTSSLSITRLEAPTLQPISQGVLSWDQVPQATGYIIKYSTGTQFETLENSYTIDTSLLSIDTTISVSAKGNGSSILFSLNRNTPLLNKLSQVTLITSLIDGYKIQWDENPLTNDYQIVITQQGQKTTYDTDDNVWLWSNLPLVGGSFTIEVIALGNGVNSFSSTISNTITLSRLTAPVLTASTESKQFEWSAVEGSTGFQVSIPSADPILLSSSTLAYKTTFSQAGSYEISIVALGSGFPMIHSLPFVLTHQVSQLAVPTGSPVLTFSQNLEVVTATVSNPNENASGYRFFVGSLSFDSQTNQAQLPYKNISGSQPFSVLALGDGFKTLDSLQSSPINRTILANSVLTFTPVNASFVTLNWSQVTGAGSYLTLVTKKASDGKITVSPPIASSNTVFSVLVGISGFVEITIVHYAIGNGLTNFSSAGTTIVYS
jgi:hypothetical protein